MRSICHMEPGDEEYFDPSCTGKPFFFIHKLSLKLKKSLIVSLLYFE